MTMINVKQLKHWIQKSRDFLITTHVNADTDALASELILSYYLKSRKKNVRIINAEAPSRQFSFLRGISLVQGFKNQRSRQEVVMIVDCGSLDRIGRVSKLIHPQAKIVNIDHHITNDNFGHLNCVNPHASSTAEVLYDLLKSFSFPIDKRIAQYLYLGIMTDTGSFRYDITTARTHRIVAELLSYNIPISLMYRLCYENMPARDIRPLTEVFKQIRISHHRKVATVLLRKKVWKKFSEGFDFRDKIFTFLRGIDGIKVALILSEINSRKTRVNLRSQGDINVARLASLYGGGGHQNASGCHMNNSLQTSARKLHQQMKRKWK